MKTNLIVLLMAAMTAGLFSGCGSKADEPKKTAAVETGESAGSESAENESPGKENADDENAGGEAEESGDAADERTTFTVGFDAEFPPYGYMDENGEYTGFDLELAQEVCARRGWELVKQPIDWDSKDMELSSGSIDCIWNGFTMNGREDAYTWSVPYVDNSQVFVVKSDAGIVSFDDFAGKIVGVQRDSSALTALEGDAADLAGTFSELRQYADYNTGFMDLEAGAIDGLAVDIGVADYQIESRGDGYVILEERLATEQYGIGFLLGNDELKQQVESTLLEMEEDGKFMEIASKYGLEDSVCLGK